MRTSLLVLALAAATPANAQTASGALISEAPVATQTNVLPDLTRDERRFARSRQHWSFDAGAGARLDVGILETRIDSFGRNYMTGDSLRRRYRNLPSAALRF